jgi:hypothetical protein
MHKPNMLLEGFHEWLLSLPWVVERPYCGARQPGRECLAQTGKR